MTTLDWPEAIELIRPFTLKVSTPHGAGAGFLLSYSEHEDLCGLATAAHVVSQAYLWEQPIRIEHELSGHVMVLRAADRAILLDASKDTAAVVFRREALPLPSRPLPLIPEGARLRVGSEVGWLGFPGVAHGSLCFFTGRVSSWLTEKKSYLVDGVAINGVSGGPAFHLASDAAEARIVGVLSAYLPNRVTGEALPGLSVVTGVEDFQEVVAGFRGFEDAKVKEPPAPAAAADLQQEPDAQPKRLARRTDRVTRNGV